LLLVERVFGGSPVSYFQTVRISLERWGLACTVSGPDLTTYMLARSPGLVIFSKT
jgi:hypothetical protein